jgi:hypothetical protein
MWAAPVHSGPCFGVKVLGFGRSVGGAFAFCLADGRLVAPLDYAVHMSPAPFVRPVNIMRHLVSARGGARDYTARTHEPVRLLEGPTC